MAQFKKSLLSTELWKRGDAFRLFTYILLNAPEKPDTQVMKLGRGFCAIDLEEGEVAITRRSVAHELGVKPSSIETSISFLQASGYINVTKFAKYLVAKVRIDNCDFLSPINRQHLSLESPVDAGVLSDDLQDSRQLTANNAPINRQHLSPESLVDTGVLSDDLQKNRQLTANKGDENILEKKNNRQHLSPESPVDTGGFSDDLQKNRQHLSYLTIERENNKEEYLSLMRARACEGTLNYDAEFREGDIYTAGAAFEALSCFLSTPSGKNELLHLGRFKGDEEQLDEILRNFSLKFQQYKSFRMFLELKSYFMTWVARDKNLRKSDYNPTTFRKALEKLHSKTGNDKVRDKVMEAEDRLIKLMAQPIPSGIKFVKLSTQQVVEIAWNLSASGTADVVKQMHSLIQGVYKEKFYSNKFTFLADAIKERYKYLNK